MQRELTAEQFKQGFVRVIYNDGATACRYEHETYVVIGITSRGTYIVEEPTKRQSKEKDHICK